MSFCDSLKKESTYSPKYKLIYKKKVNNFLYSSGNNDIQSKNQKTLNFPEVTLLIDSKIFRRTNFYYIINTRLGIINHQ